MRSPEKTLKLLLFSALLALLAGMAISWKLWMNSGRLFPVTPVSENFPVLPATADLIFLLLFIPATIYIAMKPQQHRLLWILAGMMIFIALQDQNRWQPWFYQYLLVFILFATLPFGEKNSQPLLLTMLRLIVVMTYVWSGLQKWPSNFIDEVYTWMLEPFFSKATVQSVSWTGYLLGALETLAGFGLFFVRTRKASAIFLLLMHLLILIALGPLGQNFNHVVYPWNVLMMFWMVILFYGNREKISLQFVRTIFRKPAVALVFVLYFIMPSLDFFNKWDSYLSVNLYSGNTSSGYTYFENGDTASVPPMLKPQLKKLDSITYYINIKDWSLNELHVPSYPERRIYENVHRQIEEYAGKRLTFCFVEKRSILNTPPVYCRDAMEPRDGEEEDLPE